MKRKPDAGVAPTNRAVWDCVSTGALDQLNNSRGLPGKVAYAISHNAKRLHDAAVHLQKARDAILERHTLKGKPLDEKAAQKEWDELLDQDANLAVMMVDVDALFAIDLPPVVYEKCGIFLNGGDK